ncbi:hypothetical protein K432DRAFT_297334 [Lepidopterella palustris CBS 459.81]|uniref:Uncharacterized protein n=1 Tax=Lepidopterella palustris CBS 459.81 TaxID=1314670 RepID=A0A8E2JFM0_9PEZI|nr:hypothetical protein K432DRAFT_297334 [Lepidopterella palustris CBS 459.81]
MGLGCQGTAVVGAREKFFWRSGDLPEEPREEGQKKKSGPKTYNSWDSPLVTHANTSQPLRVFNIGERTGPVVLLEVWSYVKELVKQCLL